MPAPSTIAVVIPAYRRPAHLAACISGLARQERPAERVVIVCRSGDRDTIKVARTAETSSPLYRVIEVDVPGVVAAMRAGIAASDEAIIAFTDDDAVPGPTWLARIEELIGEPGVGGVGGRDIMPGDEPADRQVVGVLARSGRLLGYHHRGVGPTRPVEVLKGVNMAFRREALALPLNLRGAGAQVHWEVAASQWARSRGWSLLYDPALTVHHDRGPRFDVDQRDGGAYLAVYDLAYNYEFALLGIRPELMLRRTLDCLLIGSTITPGVARVLVACMRRERNVIRRFRPAVGGRLRALHDLRRGPGLQMWVAEPTPANRAAGLAPDVQG